jgi:hypothetical protein
MTKAQHEFPQTKEAAIAHIERCRAELIGAVEGLSAAESMVRPAPDRWSPAEILYHLHMAEASITGALAAILGSDQRNERKPEEYLRVEWDKATRLTANREARISAPPRVHPPETSGLEESKARLKQSRQGLLDLLSRYSIDDLASVSRPHPAPAFGELTGFGWLAVIGGHDGRHLEQIMEKK